MSMFLIQFFTGFRIPDSQNPVGIPDFGIPVASLGLIFQYLTSVNDGFNWLTSTKKSLFVINLFPNFITVAIVYCSNLSSFFAVMSLEILL